ncbi:MAG: hypothetical protein ACYDC3_18575 [Candidatus Binataceae bacterium]
MGISTLAPDSSSATPQSRLRSGLTHKSCLQDYASVPINRARGAPGVDT